MIGGWEDATSVYSGDTNFKPCIISRFNDGTVVNAEFSFGFRPQKRFIRYDAESDAASPPLRIFMQNVSVETVRKTVEKPLEIRSNPAGG